MKKYYFASILIFLFGFSFIACQKDDLVTDVVHNEEPDYTWGQGDSTPIVSDFYFKGKIDSTLYVLQDSIDGFANLVFDSNYVACDADGSGNGTFYGQLTGMYTLSGDHTLEIKFLKCIADPTDVDDQKKLMFIGTFPYGNSGILDPVFGVEISWVDGSGNVWKSLAGSGATSDDSFQIVTITAASPNVLGNLVILGKMDVHLYNGTRSIRIEGGEFQFQYGVY